MALRMKCKGWILLLVVGTAWAQTPPGGAPVEANAPSAVFEQTKPPEWQPPAMPEPKPAVEQSPDMTKILQVRAEMDKAAPAPAAPAAAPPIERERSMLHNTLRASATLCLVLALILALAYVAKRVGKRAPLLAGSHLAQVVGKVYLAPRVCLYFVRAGGKVIVVGVAQNAIAALAEFDAAAFDTTAQAMQESTSVPSNDPHAGALLAQIKTSFQDILKAETSPGSEDEDVAALRKDIQRLQQYLEESAQSRHERG